jgi:hypothetical protein
LHDQAFLDFLNFASGIAVAGPVKRTGAIGFDFGIGWRGDLIEHMGGDLASDTQDSLQHIYYSEYRPKIEAMDREYRGNADRIIRADQILPEFQKLFLFLKEKRPYDFKEFVHTLFNGTPNYSKSRLKSALEI